MNYNVETILIYTILAGILSIVYGYFTGKNILAASTGNSKMQEIASAIQIGAKASEVSWGAEGDWRSSKERA